MELVFPNNLRSSIHIISIESVYPTRIISYLKNIETIWSKLKDNKPYQNTKLFFIPYQKPINIIESSNSDLMEEFSYLLHHYIEIFYQIQTLISNNSNSKQKYYNKQKDYSKQKYYILSGCCLSSFKEVFGKVIQSNKWISKHTQITKFCHNLDYVIQYFKPDKYIYDFNTKESILQLDSMSLLNTNHLTIEPITNKCYTNIENKEELVSILSKLFKYLNEWMDKEKKNKDVLCLDGAIFHNKINDEKYLLAILDFLLDN